ncbi:hypothetical protein J5Y03_17790 [Bacillus sp. RG28]|uniref:Uncharacterized protein n=1 Tax=Gottfriedia endophytica TaxID=2820819 RepID=A0A940NKL2_9BACI|nr:hypothetical protein [Gottfriedia endophytica]MBP0727014.1 hypothetical protein [Gottfriedia endophytica]
MREEISQILTMLEDKKVDKEQATELLIALKGESKNNGKDLIINNNYLSKSLRVRVLSSDGDKVNINLPLKLIKLFGNVAMKFPQSEKYLKDVDMNMIISAIENEIDGPIVDITTDEDKVFIVIE